MTATSTASPPRPNDATSASRSPVVTSILREGATGNGSNSISTRSGVVEEPSDLAKYAAPELDLALQPVDTAPLFSQRWYGPFIDAAQEEDFIAYYLRGQTIKPSVTLLFGNVVLHLALYIFAPSFLRVPGCYPSDILKLTTLIVSVIVMAVFSTLRCCWRPVQQPIACGRMDLCLKSLSVLVVVFNVKRTLYDGNHAAGWEDGFDRYTAVVTAVYTFYSQPRFIPTTILVLVSWIGGMLIRIPRAPGLDNAFNFVVLAIYLWMVYRMEAAAREQFKVHRQSYAQRELTGTVRSYVDQLLAKRLMTSMLTALSKGETVAHYTKEGAAVSMMLVPAQETTDVSLGAALQLQNLEFGRVVNDLAKKFGGMRVASQKGSSHFLVVFGLPHEVNRATERACAFATELREAFEQPRFQKGQMPHRLFIGIHCGPLHGGVVSDQRMEYQAFGVPVDLATRMSMRYRSADDADYVRTSSCLVSMSTLEGVGRCELGFQPMPPLEVEILGADNHHGAGGGGELRTVNVPIALLLYTRSKTVGRNIVDELDEDVPDQPSISNRTSKQKALRSRKRRLIRESFAETTTHPQPVTANQSPLLLFPEDNVNSNGDDNINAKVLQVVTEGSIAPEEDLEAIRQRFSSMSGRLWRRFDDPKVEQGYRDFASRNYIAGPPRWLWLCTASWCALLIIIMLVESIFKPTSLVPPAVGLVLSLLSFALLPYVPPRFCRTAAIGDFLLLITTGMLCWAGANDSVELQINIRTGGKTAVSMMLFLVMLSMSGSIGVIPWALQSVLCYILMIPEYYYLFAVYKGANLAFVVVVTGSLAIFIGIHARSSDDELREVYADSLMTAYAVTEAKEEHINIVALFRRTMPDALVEPAIDWMAQGRQVGCLLFQAPTAAVIYGEFTPRGANRNVRNASESMLYIGAVSKAYSELRKKLDIFPSLLLIWASGNAFAVVSIPGKELRRTTSTVDVSMDWSAVFAVPAVDAAFFSPVEMFNNSEDGGTALPKDSVHAEDDDDDAQVHPPEMMASSVLFHPRAADIESFLFGLLQSLPNGEQIDEDAQWMIDHWEWRIGVAEGKVVGGIISDGVDCDIVSPALTEVKYMAYGMTHMKTADANGDVATRVTVYERRGGYCLAPHGRTVGAFGRITVTSSVIAASSSSSSF